MNKRQKLAHECATMAAQASQKLKGSAVLHFIWAVFFGLLVFLFLSMGLIITAIGFVALSLWEFKQFQKMSRAAHELSDEWLKLREEVLKEERINHD